MNSRGIVLRSGRITVPRPIRQSFPTSLAADYSLTWPRTLFVDDGINVPWDMISYGFDFLDTWEVAAPIWRYDVLANDIAREADRERTLELIHDLRVMLYAHELLFTRDCDGARALLQMWQREQEAVPAGDIRLAFLRALYMVKPLMLALPNSWLAQATHDRHVATAQAPRVAAPALTRVEVSPGRFVSCLPGDAERVKAEFAQRMLLRGERRR